VVAAFAAWYSASASQKSANESKRATEASFMPIIEPVQLMPVQDSKMHYYELKILNSGRGLALNIELKIPVLNLEVKVPSIKQDEDMVLFTERTETDLGLWKGLKESGLLLEITYTDIFGNKIVTSSSGSVVDHPFVMNFGYTVAYADR
jgi:hypothetical protein